MPSLRLVASLTAFSLAAVTLPACMGAGGSASTSLSSAEQGALAAAVAAPSRTEANRARDRFRNPAATLGFFRVRANETVVELWPGGGWYTEILTPLTLSGSGTLYAAGPWERGLNGVRRLQTENAATYGTLRFAEFPYAANSSQPRVPDGSADVVLTFRNVHNWRFGGVDNTREAFRQIYAMLRPGGRLGIVEHRLPETMDSTLEESSGYMKRSSVVAFAEAAGFRLAGESEINANPRDTHDHQGGVWALPPTYRGATTDEERARRLTIGESDRMTLLFIKPE
jgi:predicted methyltransferase